MLTEVFDRRFDELLEAADRYHHAPRDPKRVVALADARWNLEIARRGVADARSQHSSSQARPFVEAVDDEADRALLRVRALGLTTN